MSRLCPVSRLCRGCVEVLGVTGISLTWDLAERSNGQTGYQRTDPHGVGRRRTSFLIAKQADFTVTYAP